MIFNCHVLSTSNGPSFYCWSLCDFILPGVHFFATKKQHSDPRLVSPGSFTGGFWREDDWKMVSFFKDDLTLPYTTNIYPLPGRPFLSRFVFRTSRLVGYVICDRSLEVL